MIEKVFEKVFEKQKQDSLH
jgi:hypothetical protein